MPQESGRRRSGTVERRTTGLDLIELWAIGQYVDGLVRGELRRHGLSGELLALLAHVHREGPRTTRELSAALGQAFMTISDQLDRLEAAGEIERIEHPRDRRSKLVTLTATGRRRVEQGSPHVRMVADTIVRHLRGDPTRARAATVDLRRAVQAAFEELEGNA
ncbi:MAG TPA: MarR family transcriptional regulator [Actinomycetota bacterium]|nr:MarR family transcriptional regulator [Actinomycetota bacterium]